jgi:hypothetical protein
MAEQPEDLGSRPGRTDRRLDNVENELTEGKAWLGSLEQQVAFLRQDVVRFEQRMDRFEDRLQRIERRLDLAEP